jgi:hypothetical protein
METHLFPMLEEELRELTAKMREFLRIVEVVRPSRFISSALRWCGLGRPMKDREKMLRVFFLEAVYDFPTTQVLIENLKTNSSLRRLCGWKSRSEVPSEATFSRTFKLFAEESVPDAVHAMIVKESYTGNWSGTQALIPRQSSEEKRPAVRIRRKSSSKRSEVVKAKRKKRRWRNRSLSKPKLGGLNFSRTGRLLKTSAT